MNDDNNGERRRLSERYFDEKFKGIDRSFEAITKVAEAARIDRKELFVRTEKNAQAVAVAQTQTDTNTRAIKTEHDDMGKLRRVVYTLSSIATALGAAIGRAIP